MQPHSLCSAAILMVELIWKRKGGKVRAGAYKGYVILVMPAMNAASKRFFSNEKSEKLFAKYHGMDTVEPFDDSKYLQE